MSKFAFEAKCVATEQHDGEFHLVGFAEDKFDTHLYLMLRRNFEDDEQDRALGMGTYHVEWCDQGMSGYGGISQFMLGPTGAEIWFEPKAAMRFDGLEHLSISFQLSQSELRTLRDALEDIFDCGGCLVVAST